MGRPYVRCSRRVGPTPADEQVRHLWLTYAAVAGTRRTSDPSVTSGENLATEFQSPFTEAASESSRTGGNCLIEHLDKIHSRGKPVDVHENIMFAEMRRLAGHKSARRMRCCLPVCSR